MNSEAKTEMRLTAASKTEMRLTVDRQPLLSKQSMGDDKVLCCQFRKVYDNGFTTEWSYEAVSSAGAAQALMKQLHAPAAPAPSKPVAAKPVATPSTPTPVTSPVVKPKDIAALKQIGIKAQQERLELMKAQQERLGLIMPMAQLAALRAHAAAEAAPPPQKSDWAATIAKHTPATKQGERR